MLAINRKKIFWFLFWTFIIGLSLYFYVLTFIEYSKGYIPENFKRGFFESKIWFIGHIAGATASLFLGPIQFWNNFRTKHMSYHRMAGKIFIIGSLIAAICAFRINLMYDCKPCRVSLGILSVIWFLVFLHRSSLVGHKAQKHQSSPPVYGKELYSCPGFCIHQDIFFAGLR